MKRNFRLTAVTTGLVVTLTAVLVLLADGPPTKGKLTATAQPPLLVVPQNGQVHVRLDLAASTNTTTYIVQSSTNLLNWKTVLAVRPAAGSTLTVGSFPATNPATLFRLVELGSLTETNSPAWSNGLSSTFAVTPPNRVSLSWNEASDDTGVAEYRLYVNGVLLTNLLGTTLAFDLTLNLHQRADIRIQAVDPFGNESAILPLTYLPGDDLLAVANDSGRVYRFQILTNGGFSAPAQVVDFPGNDRGLGLGDFDRDGLLDLVAGYPSGNTLVPFWLRGKGDGSYATAVAMPQAAGAAGYFMDGTVGDFDADGNLDYIGNGNDPYVFLYWGNGDGSFTVQVVNYGENGRGTAAGDFNEDGREDFVRATCCSGRVRLWLSNGDRTFTDGGLLGSNLGNNDPYGVAAGDFDEDGHLDLVICGGNAGDVTFWKGFGTGSFTNITGTNGLWLNIDINNHSSIDTFDYDGDGHLDLVMAGYSSQAVYYWAGLGDGTFSTNRVTLATGLGNVLGISAPPKPPRVDVGLIPIDPVTNLNATLQFSAVGSGVNASDTFLWSFGDTGTNRYAWSFTNGMANMGQTLAHTYTNEGRFLTRLLHTDTNGIFSARGTWVTIKADPPVSQPGGPYVLGETAATQAVWYAALDGSASTDDFGIVSYLWHFGDGSIVTNSGPTVAKSWNGRGPWIVGLTVTDASGQTHSNFTTVTFNPGDPPIAVINGPSLVNESNAVNGVWTAWFSATNSTDDIGIWKYEWNFGQGQTASGPNVTTTYSAVGDYTVTLTVTDHAGQTNRTTHLITVAANDLPVPVITGNRFITEAAATNGLWFAAFQGTNSTDDRGIYVYQWSFGDGGTASGSVVTHQYANVGVYPLVLTVTDFGKQTAAITQQVVVVAGAVPVPRITASTLAPEGSQPVELSGSTSTDDYGIRSYRWFLPPTLHSFNGTTLDTNRWLAVNTTQDEKLTVTGAGNWTSGYFYNTGLALGRGTALEARVDTPTGTSYAMIGFRNQDNASGSYDRLVYALYFNNGTLQVYEYGNYRGNFASYTKGAAYDIRIETRPGAGANYYWRPAGVPGPFVKIFESGNYSEGTFGVGATVNAGAFGFDDLQVQPTLGYRDVSTSVHPGGVVTLEVADHALQTNTTSLTITPVTGAPPVAVINGPTNGIAGVELQFDGYNSADDYAIASYAWDFGDGTPAGAGPAISHRYALAGVYTNRLTVLDYAGQSSSASLVVTITGESLLRAVPWRIVGGIEQPHEVYSGKTNTLKAVARGVPVPFTYVWNFGDGTGTVTNEITNSAIVYNLEATHAYTAGEGTPYYAAIQVFLTNGTVLSDTYPLVLRPKTLDTEMNVAIDEGLWWLHKIQSRYDLDANTKGGNWLYTAYSQFRLNVTASAVQAFAINGHLLTDDPARDPYVDTVQRGMNYLLSRLTTVGISAQTYGDPDGNHNGIGLTSPDDRPPYEVGPIMDAMVAAGRPELVAGVGGANVKGRTFRDIMQDMADTYAWGQYDHPDVGGGWRYGWNEHPDNSASQWGAIGLTAAEQYWGITVPAWVKERNLVWVNYSRGGGGYGYTGPGDGEATTPSALVQLAADGVANTNSLWLHGENYLANNWAWLMSLNNLYANYAITKALRAAHPAPVHQLTATGKDWFRDPANGLARVTIDRQRADGSWLGSGRGYDNDLPLSTAWSVIILSSSLFQRGPVAVITYKPNPSAVGYPVVFDARASYHQHPAYRVVEYRWDFDAANGVDFEHPDALGPMATNVYGALSTNLVTLQVRDNATPQLNDSASVLVNVSIPPFPPTADAGGPYVAAVGEDIKLDGSGSFDVDEAQGDFIQSWDWEVDFVTPLDFDDGVTGRVATVVGGFPTAGQRSIGLRVRDATSIVFPTLGSPDLTNEDFAPLYVYDQVTTLDARAKGNKIQLTWPKAGDYAIIHRSTLGPNRGFAEIGRTSSDYATFLDTNVAYNVEYYYRIFAYQNGRTDPLGISDPKFIVSRQRGLEDHPPEFLATPIRIAVVGAPYGQSLEARDPENDPFTFNLLLGPTNMTVNPTNGFIDFTPTVDQIGSHLLSFDATNAAGRDVLSFSIFVFPASNAAPVVNVNGPYAALTGEAVQFSSAGTSDPNGDSLRYFWNFGDGQSSTNPNPTHVYTGAGDYLVSLFVNDGYGGTASAMTHAVISVPNRPPTALVANGPHFNLRLGETLTLNGSGSYDLDGDPITFTWVWGNGTTNANAASTFSHVYAATGTYNGQLIVADNRGGQGVYSFDATVAPPNQPPVIALTLSTNSPFVLASMTFDATGTTDPENDPLTFEWDFGDYFKTTGPLVTHAYGALGDFDAVLKVSDGRGGVALATQTVHVLNAPPSFTSQPPLLVRAGSNYNYTPLVSDTPGDTITFALAQGPAGMMITTNSGRIDWLPGTNDVGPNAVTIRATDQLGAFADQSFNIVVTAPGGAEVDLELTAIVMTNVIVNSQSLQMTGSVHVRWRNNGADPVPIPYTVSAFLDLDGDGAYSTNADRILGYAIATAGLSQGFIAFADIPLRGEAPFVGTPLHLFVDNEQAVPEYDESNNLRRSGFDVNTNVPPVVDVTASRLEPNRTGLPDSVGLYARFGNAGYVDVPAGVAVAFYLGDPQAGGSLLGVAHSQSNLAVGRFESVGVTWSNPPIAAHTIFVVADDDGSGSGALAEISEANNKFSATVDLTVNEPPIADAGPDQTINLGEGVALNGRASSDPEGKPLTYRWQLVSIPVGSSPSLTGTDTASPALAVDAPGPYTVRLVVNDGVQDSAPDEVVVNVVDPNENHGPTITSSPPYPAMVNVLYEYPVTASDPDGDVLRFRLAQSPPGMTINTNTGLIQWTPTNTATVFVQVTVDDGRGASFWQSWSMAAIVFTNLPPVFTTLPVTTAAPDTGYSYDADAVDPNRDPVTFGLVQKPAGMTINTASGLISWTPTTNQLGGHGVRVTAADTRGGVSTQAFNVVVFNPGASGPVVFPIPDLDIIEPATFAAINLDNYVSDPNHADNQLIWSFTGATNLTVTIDPNRVAQITYTPGTIAAETITFLATDPDGNSGYASPRFSVRPVDNPPIAALANLSDLEPTVIETGFFELRGTADDPDAIDPVSYRVLLYNADGVRVADVTPKPVNAAGWRAGRVPAGGSLGTLDFTLVRNGGYTLMLEVLGGNESAAAAATVIVDSGLKIGQFSFGQQDLVLPVQGVGIQVNRIYDSLNPIAADFGYAWTYSVADIGMTFDEQRAPEYDFLDDTYFSLRTGGSRDVTIDMPDTGRRATFKFSMQPYGMFKQKATWTAPPGVNASLEPLGSPIMIALQIYSAKLTYWEAAGLETPIEAYDFPGFTLTTQDGTKYLIKREDLGYHLFYSSTISEGFVQAWGKPYLARITQPSGTRTEFVRSGVALNNIEQFDTANQRLMSILFQRDAQKRITAVFTPENLDTNGAPIGPASVTYEYDAAGNLARVNKLTDATNPGNPVYATTTYLYGLPRYPHFLTEVRDPNGATVMRVEFDADGRMIGTVDAFGNRRSVTRNISARTETVFDRLGNPTTHVYDERGRIIATTDALGNTMLRSYDGNNNQTSETDALGRKSSVLFGAGDQVLSYTDHLGRGYTNVYDAEGQLLTQTDSAGRTASNEYDAAGNVVATTDPTGRRTTYQFDGGKRMTGAFDASGRAILRMGYDGAGYMTGMTNDFGDMGWRVDSKGNVLANTRTWRNPANSNDVRVVEARTEYDAGGRPLRRIDPAGNVTQIEYDGLGQVVGQSLGGLTNRVVFDSRGNVIENQFADGTRRRTLYDAEGRVLVQTDRFLPGQPATGVRTVYDALGRVVREELLNGVVINLVTQQNLVRSTLGASGTVEGVIETEYDAVGRIVRNVHPDRGESRFVYTSDDRIAARGDALGNWTTNDYDLQGNLRMIRDAQGNETYFLYDNLGRQTQVIHADGSSTRFTFDSFGRVSTETSPAGRARDFEYNDLHKLVAVELPAVADPLAGGAMTRPRFAYEYDPAGNPAAIVDARGRRTSFFYDEFGRQRSRTLPLGQTETNSFDSFGRLQRRADFNGQATGFEYDAFGRLLRKHSYAAGSNQPGQTVEFTYDAFSRPVGVDDARGQSQFAYDAHGRPTLVQTPEGTIHYEYDSANGRRVRTYTDYTDVRYTYDAMGRLATASLVKRNGQPVSPAETVAYEYDTTGSRAAMTLPNGIRTTYQYDSRHRLTRLQHASTNGTLLAAYVYQLTPDNLRTGVTEIVRSPAGDYRTNRIAFTYDALNRLVREKATDLADNATYEARYEYDLVGNRLERRVAAGGRTITTQYAYDDNDRLIAETNAVTIGGLSGGPNNTIPYRVIGANGAETVIHQPVPSALAYYAMKALPFAVLATFFLPLLVVPLRQWRRLRIWNARFKPELALFPRCLASFLVGLLLVSTCDVRVLADEATRYALLSTDLWGQDGVTTYEYDDNGSVTRKTVTGVKAETTDYRYTLENRLAEATTTRTNGLVVVVSTKQYTYNQAGSLVGTQTTVRNDGALVFSDQRAFVLDSGLGDALSHVLEERSAPGGVPVMTFFHGDDPLAQVNDDVGATSRYYLADGHGSTRQLAGDTGVPTDSYGYDAYGVLLGEAPSVTQAAAASFLYAGEPFDAHLKQYHLRARFYDPFNGRFSTLDPFGGDSQDPQSLHKYAYAHNDPVNRTDPTGLFSLGEVMTSMAIQTILFQIALPALMNWASAFIPDWVKKLIEEATPSVIVGGISATGFFRFISFGAALEVAWSPHTGNAAVFLQIPGIGFAARGAGWAGAVGIYAGVAFNSPTSQSYGGHGVSFGLDWKAFSTALREKLMRKMVGGDWSRFLRNLLDISEKGRAKLNRIRRGNASFRADDLWELLIANSSRISAISSSLNVLQRANPSLNIGSSGGVGVNLNLTLLESPTAGSKYSISYSYAFQLLPYSYPSVFDSPDNYDPNAILSNIWNQNVPDVPFEVPGQTGFWN